MELPAQRLVVGYKSKAPEAGSDKAAASDATGKARAAGEKLTFERRTGTGGAVFGLGGTQSKAELAELVVEFKADPNVAYVEPETFALAMATPDDPEYAKQWDLFEPTGGMNVPAAWERTTGSGVTVAVIDTGYVRHPDLAANIVPGYDFVSDASRSRDGTWRQACRPGPPGTSRPSHSPRAAPSSVPRATPGAVSRPPRRNATRSSSRAATTPWAASS